MIKAKIFCFQPQCAECSAGQGKVQAPVPLLLCLLFGVAGSSPRAAVTHRGLFQPTSLCLVLSFGEVLRGTEQSGFDHGFGTRNCWKFGCLPVLLGALVKVLRNKDFALNAVKPELVRVK